MHVVRRQVERPSPIYSSRSAITILLAFLLGVSGTVAAQDRQGAPIKVGDSNVYPSIRIDYLQSDNAFLTNTDQTETTGVNVAPGVVWKADKGTVAIQARYDGNYGRYSESALDYEDHDLEVSASAGFSSRLSGNVGLSFDQHHEELGENLTRGTGETYDEQVVYQDLGLSAGLRYGARDAKGNVEVGLFVGKHTPASLESISSVNEYSVFRPSVIFSLRVSPDTRLLFEVRHSDYDYDVDSRDKTEIGLLTGATFAATGKLSGSLKVGVSQVSYKNNSNINDDSELFADADITYLSSDRSRLKLRLSRDFDNDDGLSLDAVSDIAHLAWRYDWSERFFHRLSVGRTSTARGCPSRGETTTYYGLEGNVYVRRWLEVGAGIYRRNRDGDSCADTTAGQDESLDYERQNIGVHVRATL